ncbi:MAG: UvrD-helicase domain-containing protein, partial [Paracoccaceae bacterium]|nr:UvrD-helicase domain-containing protein [Paracoccaceae bacterium]
MIHDDATLTQNRAAHPHNSTWVEANAGSGKTRVLTDRVARLLLEGVQPQHILCLTYTKAAASEMQNRLFQRLGEWAMLDSEMLSNSLKNLGVEHKIDADFLSRSRRLFAQAIEAPGGLKIQTIHSFCSSLLRRFPLEAGVSPQFVEIDERAATALRKELVDQLALGPEKRLVDDLAHHYTGEDFDALTSEILRHRDTLSKPLTSQGIYECFDVKDSDPLTEAISIAFEGTESAFWADLVSVLDEQSASYKKISTKLTKVDPREPTAEGLFGLFDIFLFKSGEDRDKSKAGRWPQRNHGKVVEAVAPYASALDAFMDRLEAAKDQLKAHSAAKKSIALHNFASVFVRRYDDRKQALGRLDFDDLIRRARDLLTDPAVAQWVLFRLDGGIDHILVDEAQDTSPIQWDVVELLAQEFTSGEGTRADVTRTLFVVGDKKQSIYSFQGADPDAFDKMRGEFGDRLASANSKLHHVPMLFSFRSSPAILNMVDYTFHEGHAAAIGNRADHEAFKSQMPGRVDLWPVVDPVKDDDDGDWTN